jgi:hypothetical protein
MNVPAPLNSENFSSSSGTIIFLTMTAFHGVSLPVCYEALSKSIVLELKEGNDWEDQQTFNTL